MPTSPIPPSGTPSDSDKQQNHADTSHNPSADKKAGVFSAIMEYFSTLIQYKLRELHKPEERRDADRRFIREIIGECEPSFRILIEAARIGATPRVENPSSDSLASTENSSFKDSEQDAEHPEPHHSEEDASGAKEFNLATENARGAYAVYIRAGYNVVCISIGAAKIRTSEQHRVHALAGKLNAFPLTALFSVHRSTFKRMVGQI